MSQTARRPAGFSLIELLIVVVILSIVAVMLLPNTNTGISEELEAAARILASDLDYAHSLAISYNSTYKVTFNTSATSWTLTYSGADSTLATLPPSPVRSAQDSSTSQTTTLNGLPGMSRQVTIYTLYSNTTPTKSVTNVEYGPLGSTTNPAETVIWLSVGGGTAVKYLDVHVNAITGLTTIGNFTAAAPHKPAS